VDTEQIKKILERYTQGQCTAEESKIIEQWFENVNRHHATAVHDDRLKLELEAVRQSIHEKILRSRRRNLRARYYTAAAACVLGLAGVWLYQARPGQPAVQKAATSLVHTPPSHSNRVVREGFVTQSTAKGATERIVLGDGSTVVLNASSKIRYPLQFGEGQRQVYLEEGEAFFTVADDPRRAFTVHTGALSTTALGTSFNIRAYTYENRITVSLLTGKVKIARLQNGTQNGASIILSPSEQVNFSLRSLQLERSSFAKPEEITGWRQGYLVFKDASYEEVMTEIENRYGVTIINQSDKTEWKYTGVFKDESLRDVIETICFAKSLSYTISSDTILLRNKR
jgi:transmembrane sensor